MTDREIWFHDRIGRRVFRTNAPWDRDNDEVNVLERGIVIEDGRHAQHLYENELIHLDVKYADSKEELSRSI